MLTPTTKYLLEDDTLELYHQMITKSDRLFDKLDTCYSRLETVDDDYDKELILEEDLTTLTYEIEAEIEEINRQLDDIEIEVYQLFDNLETLV